MKHIIYFFKNLGFRQKLILSYSIVVIIPILMLGSFSYNRARYYLNEQAKSKLGVSLTQLAYNINDRINQYRSVVDFFAINKRVQYALTNDYSDWYMIYDNSTHFVNPNVSDMLFLNNDIDKLTIYNELNTISYGIFMSADDSIRVMEWYKNAGLKTEMHTTNEGISAIRRIVNLNNFGKTIGVLKLDVNKEMLFEGINSFIKDEYEITIIDKENKLVYEFDTFKNKQKVLGLNDLIDRNITEKKQNEKGMLVLKSQIKNADWNMYLILPKSEMSVDAREIIVATVVISVACLLVLVLIIWLFSNTFVKRIYLLKSKMKQVEEGNLNLEISSLSKDEIGELTNSVGMMIKKINILIDDVYQSKLTQREAEFKALQAQINPHFLYNALSIINWKAKMIYADDISEITNTISRFYRTTLNSGKNIISIRDEIENTQAYLKIQLVMHDNNFIVNYDFEDEIFEYDMIKLILQPIVENAVMHGIDKKIGSKGEIGVKGFVAGENIVFVVSDNGPGIENKLIDDIFVKHTVGYGVNNVDSRIKLFFGNEFGLKVTSISGEGTIFRIEIPKFRSTPAE